MLVTVAGDGTLLDRRRVELVGEGLPKLPHHSEGQRLPLDEAVELVERVRAGGNDDEILEWCFEKFGRPDEEKIEFWNNFVTKRGWRDDSSKRPPKPSCSSCSSW